MQRTTCHIHISSVNMRTLVLDLKIWICIRADRYWSILFYNLYCSTVAGFASKSRSTGNDDSGNAVAVMYGCVAGQPLLSSEPQWQTDTQNSRPERRTCLWKYSGYSTGPWYVNFSSIFGFLKSFQIWIWYVNVM